MKSVIIYGKERCPYCENAKISLFENNIPFTYKQLDVDYVREDLEKLSPNMRTFPQIFENKGDGLFELIGGFAELQRKLREDG